MGWRTLDILRAVTIGVAVYFGLRALWGASTVLLVIFLGVLFGLALSTGVDRLARWHIPRALGAALIVVGVFGSLTVIGLALYPTLAEQGQEIQRRLPEAVRKGAEWINAQERGALRAVTGRRVVITRPPDTVVARPGDSTVVVRAPGATAAPDVASQVTQRAAGLTQYLFGFLSSTVEVIAYLLLTLFLAIYVAADPALYHAGLMHLFPHRARQRAGDVLTAIALVLRRWLVTQVIAMLTLGVVWAIALLALNVKAALALAVIAGFLEFIPTIGPTMAVIPALAMALLDSPQKALAVLGVYLVIQAIESNIIIPMLMKGQIDLPPALTIAAQALMTLAFGFLGLMVAVPLTAAAMVPVKLLYVEDVVGDTVSVLEATDEVEADETAERPSG
jgi:predicted PurR-regulated permease PerM